METISAEVGEALREIQIALDETLNQTARINGYGINDIRVSEIIKSEETKDGIQIYFQTTGSAVAKNKKYVQWLLAKLIEKSRNRLWTKDIFFQIPLQHIEVSESKIHEYATDGTLYFSATSVAILFRHYKGKRS